MATNDAIIRLLTENDAQAYANLRREALLDSPLAFASSPGDDIASTVESVREILQRGPDSIIFGAFSNHLVGSAGMYRDKHLKSAHKAHLWGMYVTPDFRRKGVGVQLVDAVVQYARTRPGVRWLHLAVSSAAPEAKRLYERAGFQSWGTEPEALRHEDHVVDEYHMALQLR
jgi:RimJ/RimL family protein N-acetyltransferase